jgi:hypothetical protein
MRFLHLLLVHQEPPAVLALRRYLAAVAPQSRFLICHGGTRASFDALDDREAIFVASPDLRSDPLTYQSYSEALEGAWSAVVRDDPAIDAVSLLEFDHLILRADFEHALADAFARSGADFLGKEAGDRTRTNWPHQIRFRGDPDLLAHLAALSVREDRTRIFGCLGTGFAMRREALAAFAAVTGRPRCFMEAYVPTLVHHLGFRVADVDAVSDVYRHVAWKPPRTIEEAIALKAAGAYCVHPVKALDQIDRVRAAPGPAGGLAPGRPAATIGPLGR